MIANLSLSDEIASEAADLRVSFPKGATPHDLAGWFGQPMSRIEEALATLHDQGADLSFMRPEKDTAAVALGKRGGEARAKKVSAPRRKEIAQAAAQKRWGNSQDGFPIVEPTGPDAIPKRGPYKPKDPEAMTAKEFRNLFINELPRLAKQYPDGVTVHQAMDYFCVEESRVRYLFSVAKQEWWCKIIRTRTESRGYQSVYLFNGMMERAPELTERQNQVYLWLLARANEQGEVTVPMNEMTRELTLSDGTAFGHINALAKKGYLERLTPLSARDESGVPISPRFALYDTPEPKPVQLARPKKDESDLHPGDRMRGHSVFLQQMIEHRNRLQEDLSHVDMIIAKYFSAEAIDRAKRAA